MVSVEQRLAALEARLARLRPLPTTIDGLDPNEPSNRAVDVLEMVARSWPADHLPAELCAAVVGACARPPAERVMAVGMVLGKFWPEADGDSMALLTELTRSGLLPGAA